MREIESSCGFEVNALINNSNLGADTTMNDIESSREYADKLCELSGLSLLFTSYIPEIINGKPNVNSALFEMKNMTKKLF